MKMHSPQTMFCRQGILIGDMRIAQIGNLTNVYIKASVIWSEALNKAKWPLLLKWINFNPSMDK